MPSVQHTTEQVCAEEGVGGKGTPSTSYIRDDGRRVGLRRASDPASSYTSDLSDTAYSA